MLLAKNSVPLHAKLTYLQPYAYAPDIQNPDSQHYTYTLTLVKKGRYTKINKAHPVDLLNADDNADVEAIGQALRRFEAENPMPEECLQRA